MDKQNNNDWGSQVNQYINEAIDGFDFDKLNSNISSTVQRALDEVQKHTEKSHERMRNQYKTEPDPSKQFQAGQPGQRPNQNQNPNQPGQSARRAGKQRQPLPYPVKSAALGTASGITLIILGGVFLALAVVFYILTLAAGTLMRLPGGILVFIHVFFWILIILFLWMVAAGVQGKTRGKRFKQYLGRIGSRTYCSIRELTYAVEKDERYVVRDLEKMIRKKMFPEGRLDQKKTCIMLTNEVYEQYIRAQEAYEHRQKRDGQKPEAEEANLNALDSEIRRIILDGRACMKQIRLANDNIPGAEISAKLTHLETVIGKIFGYIEQHPDQVSDIEKFMEYYLPTTLKLVQAYEKLDAQVVQKEVISNAKQEIEQSIDTINYAFDNLLDSLFKDMAMDISSDITVLETILAQEGLTGQGFKNK